MALWAAGFSATLAGLLWSAVFPINKNLWTSSFALFSAGVAAQMFAFLHWLVDLRASRWWTEPFVAFGRNALAAYLLSVGVDSALTRWVIPGDDSVKARLYETTFGRWLAPCCGPELASLGYAVAYVALWAVVFSLMSRRRIFIGI
jgi:predicted acyltransferase